MTWLHSSSIFFMLKFFFISAEQQYWVYQIHVTLKTLFTIFASVSQGEMCAGNVQLRRVWPSDLPKQRHRDEGASWQTANQPASFSRGRR
jgi:hypothetical protein